MSDQVETEFNLANIFVDDVYEEMRWFGEGKDRGIREGRKWEQPFSLPLILEQRPGEIPEI